MARYTGEEALQMVLDSDKEFTFSEKERNSDDERYGYILLLVALKNKSSNKIGKSATLQAARTFQHHISVPRPTATAAEGSTKLPLLTMQTITSQTFRLLSLNPFSFSATSSSRSGGYTVLPAFFLNVTNAIAYSYSN
ncbi:hypothetical protein QQF64_009529 [Cirrhinus molitorella]|uniref:Uncharacterized protein n=1 Tax=Cirrhinus molitorella TaxID=172907 RepID=A0ABR3M1D7_9TELE